MTRKKKHKMILWTRESRFFFCLKTKAELSSIPAKIEKFIILSITTRRIEDSFAIFAPLTHIYTSISPSSMCLYTKKSPKKERFNVSSFIKKQNAISFHYYLHLTPLHIVSTHPTFIPHSDRLRKMLMWLYNLCHEW